MALYSMFMELQGVDSFSTQVTANTPKNAVRKFLRWFVVKKKQWPKRFSEKDILLLIPMTGLVNMHLCQLGRNGEYITLTIVLTAKSERA